MSSSAQARAEPCVQTSRDAATESPRHFQSSDSSSSERKVTTQVDLAGLFEAFIRLEAAQGRGPRKNGPERLGFGREVVGGIVVTPLFGFVFGELDEEAGFSSACSTAALRAAYRVLSSAVFFSMERRMRCS